MEQGSSVPQMRRHRIKGRPHDYARVTIFGRTHHLGRWGSPEAEEKYRRLLVAWAEGKPPDPKAAPGQTVADVCLAFEAEARSRFRNRRDPDRKTRSTADHYRRALRDVVDLYGGLPAGSFSRQHLVRIRERWIELGWSRSWINVQVARVREVFRWAAEQELSPESVVGSLQLVRPIPATDARVKPDRKREPVDLEVMRKTQKVITPRVCADMIEVLYRTGMRVEELCLMTAGAIRPHPRLEGLWAYHLEHHKTSAAVGEKVILIGPRGQKVIEPHLEGCPPDRPVFLNTRGNPWGGHRFNRRIRAACIKHGIPRWTPHQLRHAARDAAVSAVGTEAAQGMLGHARAAQTNEYGRRLEQAAASAARAIG